MSPTQNLEIRYRTGSERCRPSNRLHSQSLKKLLHEHKIEPWVRDKIPLLFVDDNLAAVIGLWNCAEFVAPQCNVEHQQAALQNVKREEISVEVIWER